MLKNIILFIITLSLACTTKTPQMPPPTLKFSKEVHAILEKMKEANPKASEIETHKSLFELQAKDPKTKKMITQAKGYSIIAGAKGILYMKGPTGELYSYTDGPKTRIFFNQKETVFIDDNHELSRQFNKHNFIFFDKVSIIGFEGDIPTGDFLLDFHKGEKTLRVLIDKDYLLKTIYTVDKKKLISFDKYEQSPEGYLFSTLNYFHDSKVYTKVKTVFFNETYPDSTFTPPTE